MGQLCSTTDSFISEHVKVKSFKHVRGPASLHYRGSTISKTIKKTAKKHTQCSETTSENTTPSLSATASSEEEDCLEESYMTPFFERAKPELFESFGSFGRPNPMLSSEVETRDSNSSSSEDMK
mmetsp:Transcript_21324/g.24784  ORF Transcript_21324/g.24784 Transcript_21324/m.24784 type:complete len:124 (+) Transcript_21324:110-481(+)